MKKHLCSAWGVPRIVFCLVLGLLFCPAFAPATALAAGTAKVNITADEAREILQAWVDNHPFQLGTDPDPESDEHIVDGVEYYRFYLSIIRCCVAEILVHKETGRLFHLMSPGNNTFEPLDAWYNREHAGYREEKAKGIITYDFPQATGNIVKAVRYTDAAGDNLVLLAETAVFAKPESGPEPAKRSKELSANRYLLEKDGTVKHVWRVADFVRDCDLEALTVSFIKDAFRITDLNNNGEAEVWMSYVLRCAGDPGPMTMKTIMYEGAQKYAVRGETRSRVSENEYAGGEYTLDAAFASGPAEFAAFAKELWAEYNNQN